MSGCLCRICGRPARNPVCSKCRKAGLGKIGAGRRRNRLRDHDLGTIEFHGGRLGTKPSLDDRLRAGFRALHGV